MKRRFLENLTLGFVLLSIFLISGCFIIVDGCCKAEHKTTKNLSAPLSPDALLDVETEVGSIAISGAEVAECSVTANICVKAQTSEKAQELTEQVQIKLEPAGNKLTVRAEPPASMNKRCLCVDFDIKVPRQTSLLLRSNVGKLTVSNIAGRVDGSTNVGSVNCTQLSGDADLKTNVGSVNVTYSASAMAIERVNMETNVGSIDFTGPSNLSATVDASSQVGSIQTDLPLTVTGKIGKSLRGTVGDGAANVHLRTNVGSIKIRSI